MKVWAILLVCFSLSSQADDLSGINIKQATESAEYERMKDVYKACVFQKGKQFAKVSSVESAIKYAPIACKRELLMIKQFFLSGAFRIQVIDELMTSIEEGVQIDLVNQVYEVKLKQGL